MDLIDIDIFQEPNANFKVFIKNIKGLDTNSWSLEDWAKIVVLKKTDNCPYSFYSKSGLHNNSAEKFLGFQYTRDIDKCDTCLDYCYNYVLSEAEILQIKEYFLNLFK